MFKKFLDRLTTPRKMPDASYWVYTRCSRCGEKIKARVDLRNDLSPDYEAAAGVPRYFCRKVLIGDGHCFQQIELKLTFDLNRKLIDTEIHGGEIISKAEFEAG